MTEVLVSVVMPAYNAAPYIAESIKSVMAQTYSHWELIIVNDGSTDDTEIIAKQYALTDERIKIINQLNQKLSAARNTGIAAATGEWIAFLDADDLWLPEKLALQLQVVDTHPDVGLVFTDGYIFNHDINNSRSYGTLTGYFTGVAMYRREYEGNYIPVLSVLVRKAVLTIIGAQDQRFIACQDWDYWLRIAASGTAFYGLPDKLFYYRRHDNNMSNNTNLIDFEKACVFVKNFRRELLTKTDVTRLKSFLKVTLSELVRKGQINDALQLSRGLNRIFNISHLNSFLIALLKRRSYFMVRLLFKADSLLSK